MLSRFGPRNWFHSLLALVADVVSAGGLVPGRPVRPTVLRRDEVRVGESPAEPGSLDGVSAGFLPVADFGFDSEAGLSGFVLSSTRDADVPSTNALISCPLAMSAISTASPSRVIRVEDDTRNDLFSVFPRSCTTTWPVDRDTDTTSPVTTSSQASAGELIAVRRISTHQNVARCR